MTASRDGKLGSRRAIMRSVLFFGTAEMSSKLGLAASTLIVAAALGAHEFGQWSFAIAVTGALAIIADFGLSSIAMKNLANGRHDARSLVGNAIGMKLFAAAAGFAALAGFGALSGKPGELVVAMLVLGVASLATWFALFLQSVYRASGMTHLEPITRAGQQLLTVGAVAVLALTGAGLLSFAFAYAAAAMLAACACLVLLRARVLRVRPAADLRWWRTIGAEAWPVWISAVLWLAYFRIDIIILSYLSTDRQVGLYNMSYNAFQLLTTPPAMLVPALFPSLAQLHASDRARFAMVLRKARAVLLALAVALAAVSAAAVPLAVRVVLGVEYAGSVELFWILSAALPFLFLNYLNIYTLIAADRQGMIALATAAGAATNIALNFALVPSFEAAGAAISTVATEAVMCALLSFIAWRAFRQPSAQPAPVAIDARVAA